MAPMNGELASYIIAVTDTCQQKSLVNINHKVVSNCLFAAITVNNVSVFVNSLNICKIFIDS